METVMTRIASVTQNLAQTLGERMAAVEQTLAVQRDRIAAMEQETTRKKPKYPIREAQMQAILGDGDEGN